MRIESFAAECVRALRVDIDWHPGQVAPFNCVFKRRDGSVEMPAFHADFDAQDIESKDT